MTRNSLTNLLLGIVCAALIGSPAESGAGLTRAAVQQTCCQGLVSRDYTLTARVLLLVCWISRPGVGAGKITWSECDNGMRGLALLIGSDPAKAPMKINRWGYIAEHVHGCDADLVGVMTEAEEQSVEQASINISSSTALHSFKAISANIQDGKAQSRVSYMKLTHDYTYREVDALLQSIPQENARVRLVSLPAGAEPGFLFAVRSLVRESMDVYRRAGVSGIEKNALRRYAFAGSVYELRRKSTRELKEFEANDKTYRRLLESALETRNLTNGQRSNFSITYGIQEPIDGVPVRIVYRPRWWFEAEMLLDGSSTASQPAGGEAPCKSGLN